jgi:hypothetical protein
MSGSGTLNETTHLNIGLQHRISSSPIHVYTKYPDNGIAFDYPKSKVRLAFQLVGLF